MIIVYLLSYEMQHIFYDDVDSESHLIIRRESNGEGKIETKSIFLRDIVHNEIGLQLKELAIYMVSLLNISMFLIITVFTIIIIKNEGLLRKSQAGQFSGGKGGEVLVTIMEFFFRCVGQILMLISTVLFVPTLILYAETERCLKPEEIDATRGDNEIYFTCSSTSHTIAIASTVIGTICLITCVVFTILFVNSQFPSQQSLPQSVWDPKPRAYLLAYKVIYAFHYDLFDPKYRVGFRIVAIYIIYQLLQFKIDQPRAYDIFVHYVELLFFSAISLQHVIVILQDFGIFDPVNFSRELLPMVLLLVFLVFAIMVALEILRHNKIISKDNRVPENFESETDMELYINILLCNLAKLKQVELSHFSGDQYASSPQIFTIISRHMEECQNEECICRKYEPEFDKKFSSNALSSRRFTIRQSSSFTGLSLGGKSFGGMGARVDSNVFRKKMPIKISYESKCQIFMAEIADCLERFLSTPQCRQSGAGVGLKLQKSYFYHAYMDSSYKALFVQLENSYSCNTFRGKVHIYHIKTRIQEEMRTSQASPLSALDIRSCMKFEQKRLLFEQRITDLCLGCEQFWTELINQQIGSTKNMNKMQRDQAERRRREQELRNFQASIANNYGDIDENDPLNGSSDASAVEEAPSNEIDEDDYNVEKISQTLLDIASTIIDVKALYSQLCQINYQSVTVLQSYALVYKYILRDEYRFEEIVSTLGQLQRTNKLEQQRDNTPMFCDSDDYVLALVSGDIKDLGRISRVSRGIDQLLGFTPEELKGSKIEKIMPSLYAHIHEEFMQGFLKRGYSRFIDKNQFLLAQNKLGFLTCTLSYIKALVDLKLGLMFVAFFKSPVKVPLTYENKDGGCTPSLQSQFIRTKDAHFLLCDGKGFIHNMSQNCMKNLGLPPTLVFRKGQIQVSSVAQTGNHGNNEGVLDNEDQVGFGGDQLININRFAPNILGPEFEFDLVRGMNFIFNTGILKKDKGLAREFAEIKNRMCTYYISVTMRRSEYRLRGLMTGGHNQHRNLKQINVHEMLLFTIVINSYAFTDTPNIIIPVFREEEDMQVGQVALPHGQQKQDDMRTSKFKEFKAHVQELKMPSKVSKLRKITIGFFFFLLGVFSLNYGICVSQNQIFQDRVSVRDILYQLAEKIPSTARFTRSVLNIANGAEAETDEVLSGQNSWENRFDFYIRRISEDAETFRNLQESIYTQFRSELSYSTDDDSGKVLKMKLKDLQTDYSIKVIDQTLSSALNLYLSKALKLTKLSRGDLVGVTIPYIDYRFDNSSKSSRPATQLQQDLYFLMQNGNEALPQSLKELINWSEDQIEEQSSTFSLVSIVIAISSMLAITIIVIPLVYPLLTHYEIIAPIILHSLNKLTITFVENEVECCNQLYDHINHKSQQAAKKKAQEIKEEEDGYSDALIAIERLQARRRNASSSPNVVEINHLRASQISSNLDPRTTSIMGRSLEFPSLDFGKLSQMKRLSGKMFLDSMMFSAVHGVHGEETGTALKRYIRRGHMPPILRRASYYERVKDILVEQDSFGEDDSKSGDSSQSNYTHQDYHTSQIQAIKEMGLLDPNIDADQIAQNRINLFELSQAKSSDIPHEPIQERNQQEEKDLKRLIRSRQTSIKATMKKSKCRKLVSISLLVVAISIYLAVNMVYTYLVFTNESLLQENLRTIDLRMLCYPFSLSVLKEMISRNSQVPAILNSLISTDDPIYDGPKIIQDRGIDRAQVMRCYQDEQNFQDLVLGISKYSESLKGLTDEYLAISDQLGKEKFCPTLLGDRLKNGQTPSSPSFKYLSKYCESVHNGINQLGLHEVLNFILREQEKIIIDFSRPNKPSLKNTWLLLNSTLTETEMLNDIFLTNALHWQRKSLITQISMFAQGLFGIFDVLFGVFIAALCLAIGYIFFIYIGANLQRKIVQIYHVVMLIPYGDRTKREMNDLIKIEL